MSNKIKTGTYLQGFTQLISDATTGITNIVEAMHNRVVHPPFLPSTPIQHLITNITAITYNNIRWSTQLIGGSIDKLLSQLTPFLGEIKTTKDGEILRSALNGVIGDYLEEKGNPLKITMQFRHQSKAVILNSKSIAATLPAINGKILLMVHGSCMNDIQWTRKEHNHGEAIAKELERTPIYLNYNSGLHISTNGQNFTNLLEELVKNWPVPIEEIVFLAHSMGGLVTRSALYYGQKEKKTWTKYVKKIVFLGTPHHGAPLERIGNYLDNILEAIPYAKPFARLGKVRSAGITDLRFGYLVNEDWQGNDRFEMKKDQRVNIPLPMQISCYCIAAVIGKEKDNISQRIIGDGMVDIKSALGQHEVPIKNLKFKKENTWVAYELSHVGLLNSDKVFDKIKEWLV